MNLISILISSHSQTPSCLPGSLTNVTEHRTSLIIKTRDNKHFITLLDKKILQKLKCTSKKGLLHSLGCLPIEYIVHSSRNKTSTSLRCVLRRDHLKTKFENEEAFLLQYLIFLLKDFLGSNLSTYIPHMSARECSLERPCTSGSSKWAPNTWTRRSHCRCSIGHIPDWWHVQSWNIGVST